MNTRFSTRRAIQHRLGDKPSLHHQLRTTERTHECHCQMARCRAEHPEKEICPPNTCTHTHPPVPPHADTAHDHIQL